MRKFYNFFKTFLCLFIFLINSNITFAQQDTLVKRQYADSVNIATTVVVKNNAANDYDILNKEFKNASFGDVIFIKTENLGSTKPKAERTSFEDVVNSTSNSTTNSQKKPISETTTSRQTESQIVKLKRSKPRAAIPKINQTKKPKIEKQAKAKTTPKVQRPQKYFGVGTARKVKMKKKKLKKRKRIKRGNRKRCFQF